MTIHYKQYPSHEKYVHVQDFLQDLYAVYQRACNGASLTQDNTALCSAISRFLTKIYPTRLSKERAASTTQYAFILPDKKYTDDRFVEAFLAPILRNTPWRTSNDLESKIILCSKFDAYGYRLNEIKRWDLQLRREKKYLLLTLQKIYNQHSLLLTVNFIRGVYDPDLIAASGRSMTALGGNTILTPKVLCLPMSIEIPIESTLAKMDKLANYLYIKVFAGEVEDSGATQLDDYNTDSNYRSLIHRLIYSILTSNFKDEWGQEIDTEDFIDSSWSNMLSETNKLRLSLITYGDIIQLFDDVDMLSVETDLGHYLQKHDDKEIFQSIVILEEDEDDELVYKKNKHHKSHNFVFTEEYCHRLYLLGIQKAMVSFIKQWKKCKNTRGMSISPRDMTEGCAYKILKMVELSNKLGRPVLMKPNDGIKEEIGGASVFQNEKRVPIDKIQPYGYYVEANILCSNDITLSLNQVIEADFEDDKLQRSTLSILDSSCQIPDLYDSVFDTLWNIIDGHFTDPHCKSAHEDDPTGFGSYKTFKSDMVNMIRNSMETNRKKIHDLDEIIYHSYAKPRCGCNLLISHRFLMNVGILPHLKSIGDALISSLQAVAIFGNYKIACLLVSGRLLFNWLQQYNPTYGDFMWINLKAAIKSALRNKQLNTYLLMERVLVLDDSDHAHKPSKLERYRQVFSNCYFLMISSLGKGNFRVYRDNGNRWVEVPIRIGEDDSAHWRISIATKDENEHCQCVCNEKFYIVIDSKETDQVYCDIVLYTLSTEQLENLDAAMSSIMNVSLLTNLTTFKSSVEIAKRQCTFPLEVSITPCSYRSTINMEMRLGINASSNDPLRYRRIAYPERLTLRAIRIK
ncbi:hypothetical protein HMPREF1544_03105 [Mucor circinelloides 1006PhL]|uniref:Uncharacterized protein n=1 Tax=Mucor circinelloides f. circinelloides (strain 1006PhL) TaxID=1220926 RepID=S2JJL7_MUCC1|nr:hypothetical protein HMPREF1544_03105 [Mucor circinelloides 1006PhL]